MNRYFLLIAILQLWSTITPVAPITTWGPLAVIFTISGLKEAIDDWRRYRSDQAANERLLTVLRDGRRQKIQSQDLLVGDIVEVRENEEVPADIVLIKSSETVAGSAYIQTANLDGETNLKQRFTAHLDELQSLSEAELMRLHVAIECAHPNKNVYSFDSTLKLPLDWKRHATPREKPAARGPAIGPESTLPLTGDNLLQQATFLRNTKWVIGVVVYTGNETKLGCNKSKPKVKCTKLDDKINHVTAGVFLFQLILIIIWGIIGEKVEQAHKSAAKSAQTSGAPTPPTDADNAWYLAYESPNDSDSWYSPMIIPLRFLLLASMMIPISLKVSLDLIKLYYSLCISWDVRFHDDERDIKAKATNTSIAENLGQVAYVLSDKTGTLTENVMIFRKMCARGGTKYGEDPVDELERIRGASRAHAPSNASSDSARPSVDKRASLASSSDANAAVGTSILADATLLRGLKNRDENLLGLLRAMAVCHTVVPSYTSSPGGAGAHKLSPLSAQPSLSNLVPFPLPRGSTFHDGSGKAAPGGRYSDPSTGHGGREMEMVAHGAKGAVMPAGAFVPSTAPARGSFITPVEEEEDESSASSGQRLAGGGRKSNITNAGRGGGMREQFAAGLVPSDSLSDIGMGLSSETLRSELEDNQLSPSNSFQRLPRGSTHAQLNAGGNVGIHYASSSPDELSLVEFAAQTGVRLLEKNGPILRIEVDPHVELPEEVPMPRISVAAVPIPASEEDWEVLHVLEFSSERKRMSVVARQLVPGVPVEKATLTLLCKGADDVIFARLDGSAAHPSNPANVPLFREALNEYASQGLRTLCFACKTIPPEEYATFAQALAAANLDILNRERALAAAYETIERELTLLGCTGIEDALQEGVPQTIQTLREANVRVWMLTGDKYQTALEIAKSCELYKPADSPSVRKSLSAAAAPGTTPQGDVLYPIEGESTGAIRVCIDNIMRRALDSDNRAAHPYCLIIDGNSLALTLVPELENPFALVALQAVSVICCRTTPAQKAGMVALVKRNAGRLANPQIVDEQLDDGVISWLKAKLKPAPMPKVVLAIGDGGNDVSMIQEADVGVGIVGKEGLQAARAADFSFSRFAFLSRLLLVHGRYSYIRTAFISQYCFFKSMLICLVQLFFAFESNWSGASWFDSYSLMTYNLFYTSLPAILYVLEQDLSPLMLEHNPSLYCTSQEGTRFTWRTLTGWMARAVFQSIILMGFASQTHHGRVGTLAFGEEGQISNALAIYTACVLIHPVTIYLESTYITVVHHVVLGGTVLLFLFINVILANLNAAMDLDHVYTTMLADGEYYFRTIVLTACCVLPLLAVKYWRQRYNPDLVQNAREADLEYHRTTSQMSGRLTQMAAHSNFGTGPQPLHHGQP